MDAYELHEARLVQELSNVSAANALVLSLGSVVPAGKLWTLTAARMNPSVAETRQVWFAKVTRTGRVFPITIPQSVALSAAIFFPLVTEGMEIHLFPGEALVAYRDVATAGSTFEIYAQFIETDLPYYSYVEPLNKVVKSKLQHGSAYRSSGALSPGSPGSGTTTAEGGGSGGPSEPVI